MDGDNAVSDLFFVFVFVSIFKLVTLINWPRRSEMRARQWMVTVRFLQQHLGSHFATLLLHLPLSLCTAHPDPQSNVNVRLLGTESL